MITGAMRTTSTKVLEMFFHLPTLGTTMELAAYHLPRSDPRNLGTGHNRIWAKVDKVDSKFSMIKDHETLRRSFGLNWIVIPAKEEWEKNWLKQLRKGHVWFKDGACNQQRTGARICKYQSKIK